MDITFMEKPEATSLDDVFRQLTQLSHRRSHYADVGLVASSWAAFEHYIDLISIDLGRIPQKIGICFTAQISGSARKLDAYFAIARLHGASTFSQELDKFSKDTFALAERRNRVIHDTWLTAETGGGVARRLEATARRILRHEYIPIAPGELSILITDIMNQMARLRDLHERIKAVICA
jgi:hypothetical protein